MSTPYPYDRSHLSRRQHRTSSPTLPRTGAKREYSEHDSLYYARPTKNRRFDNRDALRQRRQLQDCGKSISRQSRQTQAPVDVRARMFIRAIPNGVTEEDVRRRFSGYGKVLEVVFKKNYGFVQFPDAATCSTAVNGERGKKFFGIRLRKSGSRLIKYAVLTVLLSTKGLEVCHHAPADFQRKASVSHSRGRAGELDSHDDAGNPHSTYPPYDEPPVYINANLQQRHPDDYYRNSGFFDNQDRMWYRAYSSRGAPNECDDHHPSHYERRRFNIHDEPPFGSYDPEYARSTRTPARVPSNEEDRRYLQSDPCSSITGRSPLRVASRAGRRDISPSLEAKTLSLPSRQGRDIPDVQAIVVGDVERGFINFVNDAFLSVTIKVQMMWIQDQKISREAVI